jgi:hypothetical protein
MVEHRIAKDCLEEAPRRITKPTRWIVIPWAMAATLAVGCAAKRVEISTVCEVPRSVGELRDLLEASGFGVIDEKTGDDPADYLIIFPEIHGLTSPETADALMELGDCGAYSRVGFENAIGAEGEDLLESSRGFLDRSDSTKLLFPASSYPPRHWIVKNYGQFLTQEYHRQAYGLEDAERWERSYASMSAQTIYSAWVRLRDDEENSARREELHEALLDYLAELDIVFTISDPKSPSPEAEAEFFTKLIDVRVDQRNIEFAKKLRPRDAVVVGVGHAPGLMIRYPGNVIVLNPVRGRDSRDKADRLESKYRSWKGYWLLRQVWQGRDAEEPLDSNGLREGRHEQG